MGKKHRNAKYLKRAANKIHLALVRARAEESRANKAQRQRRDGTVPEDSRAESLERVQNVDWTKR